jgi:hypothetical protein
VLAMLFPATVVSILAGKRAASEGLRFTFNGLQFVLLFVTYVGLAFAATFCNVCVVYTTRVRLDGGDATFGQSLRFALSLAHLILGWSAVSATIGIALRGIDLLAECTPGIGGILIKIWRLLLTVAWSIMTIFVVPVIVYEGLGPIAAIRRSQEILAATWGQPIRYYGLTLVYMVLLVPAWLGVFGFAHTVGHAMPEVTMVLFGLLALYTVGLSYLFGVARTVYTTAFYVYASQGRIPEGFSSEAMEGAFKIRD